MSESTDGEIRTLVVRRSPGSCYAIPIHDLETMYVRTVADDKVDILEVLFIESDINGTAVDAFFFGQFIGDDSAGFTR